MHSPDLHGKITLDLTTLVFSREGDSLAGSEDYRERGSRNKDRARPSVSIAGLSASPPIVSKILDPSSDRTEPRLPRGVLGRPREARNHAPPAAGDAPRPPAPGCRTINGIDVAAATR